SGGKSPSRWTSGAPRSGHSRTGRLPPSPSPVARVHISNADQVGRSQEGEQAAELVPPPSGRRNGNGPVDILQGLSLRIRLLHHGHTCPRDSKCTGNQRRSVSRSLY